MKALEKIDPLLYGYFSDEALEHGERVGLALLYGAKNIKIRFSDRLLPETAFISENGSSSYTPPDGLSFDTEKLYELAAAYPEEKAAIEEYIRKINIQVWNIMNH